MADGGDRKSLQWNRHLTDEARDRWFECVDRIAALEFSEAGGLTKLQMDAMSGGSSDLVAKALINRDPSMPGDRGGRYDLTQRFLDQFLSFPFGSHDDLIDATSRIFDMDPVPPMPPHSTTGRPYM